MTFQFRSDIREIYFIKSIGMDGPIKIAPPAEVIEEDHENVPGDFT